MLSCNGKGPNPWKVVFVLEELQVPYELKLIKLEDFKKKPFTDINPNGRVPAIDDPNTGLVLWESGAILTYLAEEYDKDYKLSYASGSKKHHVNQYLFFQVSGQGPYFGQAAWFLAYHPEKVPSAIERYQNEIRRVLGVLDGVLEGKQWLVGDKMTYADLAFVSYNSVVPVVMGWADDQHFGDYPNVKAWHERLTSLPSWKKTIELRASSTAKPVSATGYISVLNRDYLSNCLRCRKRAALDIVSTMALGGPTDEHLAYMKAHAEESRAPGIIACATVCIVFSTAFVALRLYARHMAYRYMRLDLSDWLLVGSWLSLTVFMISLIVGTKYGGGRHMVVISDMRPLIIVLLIGNGTHPVSMGCLKLSILALYASIFPSRKFHHAVWGVAAFTVVWAVASVVAGVAFLGVAFTSSHIATDLIMLAMPIPLVMKLQVSSRKKKFILITFVVGGSVCIVSIVRLPLWLRPVTGDVGWEQMTSATLAAVELTVGILAASIPTYGPLIKRALSDGDQTTKTVTGLGTTKRGHDPEFSGFRDVLYSVNVSADHHSDSSNLAMLPRGAGITVVEDIELMRQPNRGGGWMQLPEKEILPKSRP
ncbi:hypothetical protein DL768_002587 [Monosporascus sp. mg162]|nr:hypothetical protein DL768_002587 [Monosporascus sp. mg162]